MFETCQPPVTRPPSRQKHTLSLLAPAESSSSSCHSTSMRSPARGKWSKEGVSAGRSWEVLPHGRTGETGSNSLPIVPRATNADGKYCQIFSLEAAVMDRLSIFKRSRSPSGPRHNSGWASDRKIRQLWCDEDIAAASTTALHARPTPRLQGAEVHASRRRT